MGIQKFLKFILPEKTFKKVEGESRKWFLVCECGNEMSLWEKGGVRICAASAGKKVYFHCPKCETKRWMRMVKKEQ